MLPFLDKKKMATTIMETRGAAGDRKPEQASDSMKLAESLMRAIDTKDIKALAAAIDMIRADDAEETAEEA